jgi:hypothetical protein
VKVVDDLLCDGWNRIGHKISWLVLPIALISEKSPMFDEFSIRLK